MQTDQTINEHFNRYKHRFGQYGYHFVGREEHEDSIVQVCQKDKDFFYSFYIKEGFRGQGLFEKYSEGKTIITHPECGLENFLKRKNIDYVIPTGEWDQEYNQIEKIYGDRRAKRSGNLYINHIDEGLTILNILGAEPRTLKAFCLHPLYQDSNVSQATSFNEDEMVDGFGHLYASIANSLLRKNYLGKVSVFGEYLKVLDDFPQVKLMLIADKIQNYKDFKNNIEKYKESEDIETYFDWWLDFLEVSRILENFLTKMIG